MSRIQDLTDQKFGRIKVIGFAGMKQFKNGSRVRMWNWECVCGKTGATPTSYVTKMRSCGCIGTEKMVAANKTRDFHQVGEDKRLFSIWRAMIDRCTNPKNGSWRRYGGRGIAVCPEWSEAFDPFRKWALANGYAHNLTIDRRNNDLGYSPENCRWITTKRQNRNKSDNKLITMLGETKCLADWADDSRCTVGKATFNTRILTEGWEPERALLTPRVHEALPRTNRKIEAFGKSLTPAQWARETGIGNKVIRERIKHGWDIEKALTDPVNRKALTAFGRTQTIKEWSTEFGVTASNISNRINSLGWDTERALTEPCHEPGQYDRTHLKRKSS